MVKTDDLPKIPMDEADYWQNPYETLRVLRENHRLARTPQDTVALLHWDDGYDTVRGSQFIQEGVEMVERLGFKPGDPLWVHRRGAMGTMEGDSHRRVRSVASSALTKRKMDQLRPLIRRHANALLDKVVDNGELEVYTEFARRLPKIVMAEYMGVDEEEMDLTMPPEGASSVIDAFSPDQKLSDEMIKLINDFVQTTIDNTEMLYERRRWAPRDDLLSEIIQAEREQGALSAEERVNLFSVIFGSGTSTAATIANGLCELARHPEQAALVRAEPEAYKRNLSEETLRYHPAINQVPQKAATSTTAFGMDFEEGDLVTVIIGAANHDGSRWNDPDRFDIRRDPSVASLTFGFGPHVCLGHAMARATIEEALATFVERCDDLTQLEEPRRVPFVMENKMESLRLGFTAR